MPMIWSLEYLNVLIMKKILEVLQYGEFDFRFNTDIDVSKNPEVIPEISSLVSFNMATQLWGGNEQSVLAMIRCLAIADLSLCAHRKAMLREMDQLSQDLAHAFQVAKREFEKRGGIIQTFGPEIQPGKIKS